MTEFCAIPLKNGGETIVDKDDFEFLNSFTWYRMDRGQNSYAYMTIYNGRRNRKIYLHRFLLQLPPKKHEVDHADNNGLNNRRENLRICTRSQNMANMRPRPGGSSKFKGVSWESFTRKWSVRFWDRSNGRAKLVFRQTFDDEIEAAKCYDREARRRYGEFARVNFPEDGTEPAHAYKVQANSQFFTANQREGFGP